MVQSFWSLQCSANWQQLPPVMIGVWPQRLLTQESRVHLSSSLQSFGCRQHTPPVVIGVKTHALAEHVSDVHTSASSHSVLSRQQPATGWWTQRLPWHRSDVHKLPSSQCEAVV